ncbi:BatD family protein [Thermomonas sp.]|uniref:BatD family protein n=1 Tax=Thermomonas sp. TaxID=1971895 RepID=UPI0025950055|nr:BatD family protein [Thermomonas sp.]HQE08799.1 BatD family protein [Thermomonas sp.]
MKRACLGMLLLMLLWATSAFAQTRAVLDRTTISFGETVVLTIETDQGVQQIDYAPLQRQFEIGGQSVRRSYALVNGRASATTVFSIGLRPRGPGVLTLPALRVGNAVTAPLRLLVQPPSVQQASAHSDVFVETQVDASQPYVQQAVGVTVRLNYAVPLLSGQLDLDTPDTAGLQQVGEDATYERDIGGRRYHVVERHYLLIPERSGPLRLSGARFNGLAGGGFVDQLFDEARHPLSAASSGQTLQVQPIPVNAAQPWLPLHALTLRYLNQPASARVGQATTVQIEAVADGATAAQMPTIEIPATAAVSVFADPPQVEDQLFNGRPRTTLHRKFSLVPNQAGAVVLAGPKVAWWDAEQHTARIAELPPLSLQVAAGVASATRPQSVAPVEAVQSTLPQQSAPAARMQDAWISPRNAWLLLLLILIVSTGWGGMAGYRRHRARSAAHADVPVASRPVASLQQALRDGVLQDIGQALVQQAGLATDALEGVCTKLADPVQVSAVRQLQQARWGGGDAGAALQALRKAFSAGAHWRRTSQQAKSLLPPLYPE